MSLSTMERLEKKLSPVHTYGLDKKRDSDVLRRLGSSAFSEANQYDRSAALAAAASDECDTVIDAWVGEKANRTNTYWVVDCANRNRFRVTLAQAKLADARAKGVPVTGQAVAPVSEPACTWSNVAACEYTDAQKKFSQATAIQTCDALLEGAVLSLPSLKKRWSYDYGMADPNRVVVEREFDSSNAFGAMLRGKYRCEIDAASGVVKRFAVQQPNGWKNLI